MGTDEWAPLARKSGEQAVMLAEYIFQRYDSSTAHHRGGSNAAAGPLSELAKLCRADGCARTEQSYHSRSSTPAAVASPVRGCNHEMVHNEEDEGNRGPLQQAWGDIHRHQATTTVLRSLLALVLSTSAPSVMVPTKKAGDRDDVLSDNHNRLKPPPLPPPPQPQSSPGYEDETPSDNHSHIKVPSPPPPPSPFPPQSKPQPPPVEAVNPMRSGIQGVDPNNIRRKLFDGVLRLLEEVVADKGGGGNDDKESEQMRPKLGPKSKYLLWDIVVAILSDNWSEIRKMGAKHCRSLAVAVGPTEARVFYLRVATRCKDYLLHQRSENGRDWTKVHGFLLGMRAIIDGAAEASIIFPDDDNPTTGEAGRLVHSSLSRGTPTLAKFTDDVMKACEGKESSRTISSETNNGTELPVERMPREADRGPTGSPPSANSLVCISDEPPKTDEEPETAPTPQARPLPPTPPSPPAPSPTETAFTCLSHRQEGVREAAVELLYALARSLGVQAALIIYERTMGELRHEQERAENVAIGGRGGACGADARRGRKEGGSSSENRRSCDRVSGLLGLLERIVSVIPPETVGESWGRLFPLLRSYIRHPEASLRQAVGAVLLQIATASESPASSSTRVNPPTASTTSDISSPAENLPRVARHTSARIVLWVLIRVLKESSDEVERAPHCRQPTNTNSSGESNTLLKTGKVDELRRRGLPTELSEDLCINYVGGETVMQPGLVAKDAGLEVALERQEGVEESDKVSPPRCNGGAPTPVSNGGECLAAGATVGENCDGCSSSGGGRITSWEQHEGVIMVCEGILKNLVEKSMAEIVFSSGCGSRVPPAAAVKTQPAVAAARVAVDSVAVGHCCGWPISLINATPSLSDLLLSLERLAEDVLFESELGLSEHSAYSGAGDDNKDCSTEVASLALGASPGGSLELWRAGSQILPSIARAMVWWNPAAIRGVCERAAQTEADGDLAGRISPSFLLLQRRTRLSVACELLSASVRYARHLAEMLTDQAVGVINHTSSRSIGNGDGGSEDAPQAVQAGTAEVLGDTPDALVGSAALSPSEGPPCGSAVSAADTFTVSVTNRERWGGSTEGIADSGVAGSSLSRLPGVTASASVGSTAAGEAEGVKKHPAATVAQIVRGALELCGEAPQLLARALEGFMEEKETPDEIGESTPHQSTGRPTNTLNGGSASGGEGTRLLSSPWIFTGVVEALILAESFRATTVCLPSAKTPSSDQPRGGDAERRLASSRTFLDVETTEEIGTPLPDPDISDAQHPPTTPVVIHSMVERQLHLLHQVVLPTPPAAGEEAKIQPTAVRGQNQACTAAALTHECFLRDVSKGKATSGEGKSAGAESEISCGGCGGAEEGRFSDDSVKNDPIPTKLAIPFSWGSLPLVRVPRFAGRMGDRRTPCLSYRRGKDTRAAAVGGPGELPVMRPSETARKAAQLDRLLSARVVRALPGYVSSLPPQRGIRIVLTLLRWLEASDHKLRWISVTPLEAHELLLSAISIALQDARVVDRRDEDESHPLSEASRRPLPGYSPAPAGNGTASVLAISSASASRQQQQQQQQQIEEEVVMRGTVETLSRVFGSSARLPRSSSLFCQMCEIASNAVDTLSQLRAGATAKRQHCCFQLVEQGHRFHTYNPHGKRRSSQSPANCRNKDQDCPHSGGECVRCCGEEGFSELSPRLRASSRATSSSEIGPEEGRHVDDPASCIHDETMESTSSSLLCAVAEHLVRWQKVGMVDKEGDGGTCGSRSGCVQTEASSSPLVTPTASGPQPTVNDEGSGGRGHATSGSSSSSSSSRNCASNWDDWDDDDSGDDGVAGETMRGGGRGDVDDRNGSSLLAGGVGYTSKATGAADLAVLRCTAALMKSVAALTMMVPLTTRNHARAAGAIPRAEGSSTIPTAKSSPSSPHKDQRSGSLIPPTLSRECREEAICVATTVTPTGTGVIEASSSSVVAEETSHYQGTATVDDDRALVRLLEERFLGALPVQHRQALLLAWRLGLMEKRL